MNAQICFLNCYIIFFRDFVKSTISSYKTTAELIDAMQEVDPEVPVMPLHQSAEKPAPVADMDELQNYNAVTDPDMRHD